MPKEIEAKLGSDPELREARGEKFYREFATVCWFAEGGTELKLCGHEHDAKNDEDGIVACSNQKRAEGLVAFVGLVLEERSYLRSVAGRFVHWLSNLWM